MDENIFAGFLVILGGLAVVIFMPIVTFWCAYFGGWILAQFVGERIVFGFNMLFGRQIVTLNTIPVICASLCTIGAYFKSSQTNNNK